MLLFKQSAGRVVYINCEGRGLNDALRGCWDVTSHAGFFARLVDAEPVQSEFVT